MSANYYVIPTDYGRSLIRQAHQNQPMQLKNIVIGDANNEPFTPESRVASTALINQRASLTIQKIEAVNATTLRVMATLPSRIGGFFIHEVGITDINDKLVYIGNYHGNYKPAFTQGASSDMSFYVDIVIDKSAVINVAPHDSIIANQDWVHEQIRLMREHFEAQLKIERERVIEDVSVGELFFTTIDFKTAEEVTKHKGYGKWARFGNGEAIVSLRHKDTVLGQEWLNKIASTSGSYTHQLTIEEIPRHKHIFRNEWAGTNPPDLAGNMLNFDTGYQKDRHWDSVFDQFTNEVGGDKSHNNIQPSIVVGVWQRLPDTAVKYDGTIKLDGSHRYE